MKDAVKRLKKFKPKCLFGYPSTVALFCDMASKLGYKLDKEGIKVVFSTAEVLYEHQRKSISSFFGGVPVVDCYGSREGGFICHECKEGQYHVIDSNYLIEYLQNGNSVDIGQSGEVVLTHLDAWGMPFIRYRTGDVARPAKGGCRCGKTWSTIEDIQGRTTDFIVTPDGRWQHALSLIYVVRDIEGVDEFKIIQNKVDDVEVLLKVHEDIYPTDGGRDRIIKGFHKRMGSDVNVTVTMVESIPRDASGKYRYVVSKVGGMSEA